MKRDANIIAHKLAAHGLEMQEKEKTHIIIPECVKEEVKRDVLEVTVLED